MLGSFQRPAGSRYPSRSATAVKRRIVVGLLVLFAGPLLVGMMPVQSYWSDEDQAAYEKASTAAHAAAFGGEHDHSQPHSHDISAGSEAAALRDATRAEFAKHEAKLKAAQASQKWLGFGLRVLGVLLAAGGVLLYVRARRAEPG